MRNYYNQIKKIFIHKWWVLYYSYKLGIPYLGIKHDMSKFNPDELCESAMFYQGDKSPIPVAKKELGYSVAWLHHKGRNKHHFEYWVDVNEDGSMIIAPMPCKYIIELVADWLGAFRAYRGYENFKEEYAWWLKKRDNIKIMHPLTIDMIDILLETLAHDGCINVKYSTISKWYDFLLLNSEKNKIIKP
jgi:hypothetical protein